MFANSRESRALHPVDVLGWQLPSAPSIREAIELIARMLTRSPPSWERLRPYARFAAGGYTRTVLHRSRRRELIIAGWLPGQRSAIHDHGRSSGAVLTLLGSLVERRFSPCAEGLTQGEPRIVREGDVLTEHPGVIHRVENVSTRPAATLHIYLPPLEQMGIYDGVRVLAPEEGDGAAGSWEGP